MTVFANLQLTRKILYLFWKDILKGIYYKIFDFEQLSTDLNITPQSLEIFGDLTKHVFILLRLQCDQYFPQVSHPPLLHFLNNPVDSLQFLIPERAVHHFLHAHRTGNPLQQKLELDISLEDPTSPVARCHSLRLYRPEPSQSLVDFPEHLGLRSLVFWVGDCVDTHDVLLCSVLGIQFVLVCLQSGVLDFRGVALFLEVLFESDEGQGFSGLHSLTKEHTGIELWPVDEHYLFLRFGRFQRPTADKLVCKVNFDGAVVIFNTSFRIQQNLAKRSVTLQQGLGCLRVSLFDSADSHNFVVDFTEFVFKVEKYGSGFDLLLSENDGEVIDMCEFVQFLVDGEAEAHQRHQHNHLLLGVAPFKHLPCLKHRQYVVLPGIDLLEIQDCLGHLGEQRQDICVAVLQQCGEFLFFVVFGVGFGIL